MTDGDQALPVLEVSDLRKTFGVKGGGEKLAVDGVSFSVMPGECVGLVGESGSGKSTVANMVLRLLDASGGTIVFMGEDITRAKGNALRKVHRNLQAVFQNPVASFDPRRALRYSIMEGMRNDGVGKGEASRRADELAKRCGLPLELLDRHPREASGGQCQRCAIARAIAESPSLLVCDEATSALDVTVQRQIVELIDLIRRESGMAVLFISHDIALVSEICDRMVVMKGGRVVEQGPTRRVIDDPATDYVWELLSASDLRVAKAEPAS